jgi:hypothetical protein
LRRWSAEAGKGGGRTLTVRRLHIEGAGGAHSMCWWRTLNVRGGAPGKARGPRIECAAAAHGKVRQAHTARGKKGNWKGESGWWISLLPDAACEAQAIPGNGEVYFPLSTNHFPMIWVIERQNSGGGKQRRKLTRRPECA